MSRKPLMWSVVVMVVTVALAACAAPAAVEEPAAAEEEAPEVFRVAMVLHGAINDQSWNQAGYGGLRS